jgi:hypothetical protein
MEIEMTWNSNIPGNDAPHCVASTSQIGADRIRDGFQQTIRRINLAKHLRNIIVTK